MQRYLILTVFFLAESLLAECRRADAAIKVKAPITFPSDPILVGAGDIAHCGQEGAEESSAMATAMLLESIPGTVFTAGDNVYPDGSEADFQNCYEPTWGRFKARTFPSLGNNDIELGNAGPYFAYFGENAGPADKGYYSFDLGAWHIVVLNSTIDAAAGSEQEQWLRADLASSAFMCTLAIWHHPLFSSGRRAFNAKVHDFWIALYDHRADVVVNGHGHHYERFAPQNPVGRYDAARGILEFVVGTGGAKLARFRRFLINSQVRNNTTHGVLMLTLHPTSYDWEFIPIDGGTFSDKGSSQCVA